MTLSKQERIGNMLLALRKAHAAHNNMSIAQSQEALPMTQLLENEKRYQEISNPNRYGSNGTHVGNNR